MIPAVLPPCCAELLRSGRMSPAVDVYSFGVMMWELFTNQVGGVHSSSRPGREGSRQAERPASTAPHHQTPGGACS